MQLPRGHHLAYCTNIHPGETWPETLAALEQHTLAVRARVCPDKPFGIGLRLSDLASRQLSESDELRNFRRWLERNGCYVFTINGFPFGQFHGGRVKENVYLPDWTSPERVAYTNRLFDLLAQLVPEGIEGSVSTVPGSFKEFVNNNAQPAAIRRGIFECVEHVARLAEKSGRKLHLGLEPEPLGWIETTSETVDFFDQLRNEHPGDGRINEHLGVAYDTCHLAVEFEEAGDALARLRGHSVKISKFHLSSALKVKPTPLALSKLAAFADDTYLHQVIALKADGSLARCRDLDAALKPASTVRDGQVAEWRIHFHIPLHAPRTEWFDNTTDHLCSVLDSLGAAPDLCSHLEMETYTWGVLPADLKSRSVEDQLADEYKWCLRELRLRGLA